MENIYYLLIFFLFAWYFVYLRQVSEAAKRHVNRFCTDGDIQFIAIARRSSRLKFTKQQGLCLYSIFDFEFSGDGESNNNGHLTLFGLKLEQVHVSPYRVN